MNFESQEEEREKLRKMTNVRLAEHVSEVRRTFELAKDELDERLIAMFPEASRESLNMPPSMKAILIRRFG